MPRAPALLLLASLTACGSTDDAGPAKTDGGSDATDVSDTAEAATPRKSPGLTCAANDECACIQCTCVRGKGKGQYCNAGACGSVKEICDQVCGTVIVGGMKDTWAGVSSIDPACADFF